MFISKLRWLNFCIVILIGLIVISNLLIYHLEIMQPLPHEIVLASLFDFLIIIPFLVYLFILKKRYSLKYLPIVVFIGYVLASVIIPKSHLAFYSFINYFLIASEAFFVIFELYIFCKVIRKLPKIIKKFRENKLEIPYFQIRLDQVMTSELKQSRLKDIIVSELAMYYYSLFSWKRKQYTEIINHQVFTFHKKTSSIALFIMLIHALILESVGFHFLLYSWNPVLSGIALVLNIYTFVLLVAEIQCIRNCPFIITDQILHIQVGLIKHLTVSLENIKSIEYIKSTSKKLMNEKKETFNAILKDFIVEEPTLEIELYKKEQAKLMYGFKHSVLKIHLRPDEPEKFYEELSLKVKKLKSQKE
ncbi:hypothetical protein V5E38_00890 [Rossellomorea sp. GAMAL-10_SWC]